MDSKHIPAFNFVERANLSMSYNADEYIQRAVNDMCNRSTDKYEKFKTDLSGIEAVSTIPEAKLFMKNLLQNLGQTEVLYFDNATCRIYDELDSYRVVLDSDTEMICYDFSSEQ